MCVDCLQLIPSLAKNSYINQPIKMDILRNDNQPIKMGRSLLTRKILFPF